MEGSGNRMGFPPYRRQHLRSNTYDTLVRILSLAPPSSTPPHSPTHHLQNPDNGSGKMEQEKQQKEPECSEFVGSDVKDLKDPVPQKEIPEVHETIEGLEDKGKEFNANKKVLNDIELMMGIEKDESSLRRQVDDMSMQMNGFNMEQRLMNELELVVKGTEDLVCDNGLIHEKRSVSNEVDLMDYEVEHVEFKNADVNNSGKLQVPGDIEEGEISGDFGVDDNSFDMSSVDSLILQQKNIDEVQKPKKVVENTRFPCTIRDGEIEEGYKSNSFIVNVLQDGHNFGHVEPSNSDKNGIACGVEVAISRATIKEAGKCGSVLKLGSSKDTHMGSKGVADLPTNLAQNQVRGLLEVDASKDHGSSSAVKQKVDVSSKKKRGPGSEEKKAKKKLKQRKKRAEMNKQLGVTRLKLPPPPVQKPKTITHCRHYRYGRCHEGNKCNFSHDIEPLTKSKPCCHFARHSCMKGDDCPFDHQLSKYSCTNFVSGGSCSRGDACMFSHQVPIEKDIPTLTNVSRPELKSPLNTNFSMPLNDHGCSPVQQNPFSNSTGIHSHINADHKVTSTVQKHSMPPPKGISFMNVAKSSLLSPSTLKQGTITTNKGSHVKVGTYADQSASGTNQTMVEIPTKLPAVTPKGINFLSFGKDSVCSFKSSISSLSNRESGIKLPQLVNFGFPEQASSSLNKDDYSKVSDETQRSVPQTDLFSNEVYQRLIYFQSVAEEMKLNFPGKPSIDDARTDLQYSFNSHGDHSHSKSVQKGKNASDNSQSSTSTVTSSILSTLAFAAEHESDIKMKDPSGASFV